MLTVDVTGCLGKTITPSLGVPDQEMTALHTPMKRYIEEWLEERRNGQHAWGMDPYNKVAVDRAKAIAKDMKQRKIQTVVWIGIGGSGLGPRVIQEVFETAKTMELIVLD